MKRLAVIDGKSVFYRGYYAMPGLSTADGTPTGGVYGFASLALELIKRLEPDYVAVAWDKKGTNIRKRRELYPEYKAGRKPAPDDFYAQVPILMELLEAFGWPLYELDDYEADDIMGTFARQASERGVETILITSDLDALQVIGPTTQVYALKNGLSNLEAFDTAAFEQKYGIRVEQFLDFKALKGDASDNLPGVPGVGEKTALKLLGQYHDLDTIFVHLDEISPPGLQRKLRAGRDLAYLTRQVGKIWTDAPVTLDWQVADVNDIDLARVAAILDRLQFRSLVRRLPAHMRPGRGTTELPAMMVVPWHDSGSTADQAMVMTVQDGQVWVSPRPGQAMHCPIGQVDPAWWQALATTRLVAYDGKALYHQLADQGVVVPSGPIHDVRQAAFLLDPLQRDRSLAALAAVDPALLDDPTQRLAALWELYNKQQYAWRDLPRLAAVAQQLDFPLIHLLFRMERRGVRIDRACLARLSAECGQRHRRLAAQVHAMVGYEFNVDSPAQLSAALFTKLQLPTTGIKKGKTGYSTSQKELDKLRGQHPIIGLIEQTRELAKLKNTYIDTLPDLADADARVHTTFHQDATATGRLSSTNPNLQNIPVRSTLGRRIRGAFIASPGRILVSADYSQFELRLAAALAGDQALINDFNAGVDIHTKTASDVYGTPLGQVTKEQRRAAKVINFGVLYGMSPHGLATATGMTLGQARQFIEHYFYLRAPIRQFIDHTIMQARQQGYVETYFGRRRPTPDINSRNFVIRSAAERAAANLPIQGTEADLMKRAMLSLEERLAALGNPARQLLQVHDSILVETTPDQAATVGDLMRQVMESVCPELPVQLRVDVSTGQSWDEL